MALTVCILLFASAGGTNAKLRGEELRPLFHFTPRFGWTNDPNGMNYRRDPETGIVTNHLFYQANPNSTVPPWSAPWKPAYWGHAVSADLVHWREVAPSAIRGASGAILVLPDKMRKASSGVVAIAFENGFWTTHDADELDWVPPMGCIDSGPPAGKLDCNASAMNPLRPGRGLVPLGVNTGDFVADPTVAWVERDGRLYSVFASSTLKGQYQALLFRTRSTLDPFSWEFVSVLWQAPLSQQNPKMGLTNCPDFFQLPSGRWAFAYLSHATSFAPYRILWFTGTCEASWRCVWGAHSGMVDASSAFVASQSFTDAKGRRILMGWIGIPGYNVADSSGRVVKGFAGGQSIPRVVSSNAEGTHLHFLPLPELSELHGQPASFAGVCTELPGCIVAQNSTNSFHLNLSVAVDQVSTREPVCAGLDIEVLGGAHIRLLPPFSDEGQRYLHDTDTEGPLLQRLSSCNGSQATADWCASHCLANASCGAWTLRTHQQRDAECSLKIAGGLGTFADAGSGCDAEGTGEAKARCVSGIVDWQLAVPGLKQPMPVVPRSDGTLGIEIFVDKVMAEVFLHDARGDGAAVATLVHVPKDNASSHAVVVKAEGPVTWAAVRGELWPMHGSISPPPAQVREQGIRVQSSLFAF